MSPPNSPEKPGPAPLSIRILSSCCWFDEAIRAPTDMEEFLSAAMQRSDVMANLLMLLDSVNEGTEIEPSITKSRIRAIQNGLLEKAFEHSKANGLLRQLARK